MVCESMVLQRRKVQMAQRRDFMRNVPLGGGILS